MQNSTPQSNTYGGRVTTSAIEDDLDLAVEYMPEQMDGPVHQGAGHELVNRSDSQFQYTIRKKSEMTYAKNATKDITYKVKVNDHYHCQRLHDVRDGLHLMFDEVLDVSPTDLKGTTILFS